MTPRIVTPEILDGLPNHNPAAIRSRRDLRRVHRAMGTRSIISRALRSSLPLRGKATKLRILEIGAGDGHLMLGVARTLQDVCGAVDMTLLDKIDLVEAATIAQYAVFGWNVTSVRGDVVAWASDTPSGLREASAENRWDLVIANLFLHHFKCAQLCTLLAAIEARADCFVACEPRRSAVVRTASQFIGALGVNAVTRADAVSSVKAGFCDAELSALWPGTANRWALKEYAAGLFSHCFVAERSN